MKGNNTLTLNEATLIEAVQLLLDRDAPAAGKVTQVREATMRAGAMGGSPLFEVHVSIPGDPPNPAVAT